MTTNRSSPIDELAVHIIETLRQPLLILDGDLRVMGVNRAFYECFQAAHEETVGRFVYDLGNGQWNIPALKLLLEDIIPRQNTIEDFEVNHNFPVIGERVMILNARRLHQNGGHAGMILLAIEDVTERRRVDQKLRQYNEALQRSNEELQQFAYVASHDLQEPLRAISGYVQLLQRNYKLLLDEKAHHYIAQAVDSAARLQALINDLLAYSRVGSRGRPFAACDCGEALRDALRDMETLIAETGAQIVVDPLPIIEGDMPQLTSLFQNLIHNAIKYRGAHPPRVHIRVERQPESWLFSVQDNGIGIEPEYFERIFVIFQRLHTRREYPGTGIGLAVAKRIVERHGGRIWVESEFGAGSVFHFTIPDRKVSTTEIERNT